MRPEVISKMQEIVGKDYVISGEENIQPMFLMRWNLFRDLSQTTILS